MKFRRVKHIVSAIQEVADNTGYDFDFLAKCYKDLIEDGETPEAAFAQVRDVAYEYDY